MLNVPGDDSLGIFQGQRRLGANTVALDGAMEAFDLAVALGIVRRGLHMRHATDPDELLEVAGDELGAVVGDDPWGHAGKAFATPLDDLLDFRLGHGGADLPVDDEAATAIEDAAQVVKGAAQVQVRDVHMPVFVRREGLHKAGALGGRLAVVPLHQPGGLEDTVDAGGAADGDVGVDHHEGEPAVALQGEALMEVEDGLAFLGLQPVVPRDPGVVLVDLAVAVFPGVPLGGGDAEPEQEAANGDAGLVGPPVDEVHDGVAGVVGNPDAGQSSPSAFFSWTCSSMSSERTSCLRRSLSPSSVILRSLASVSILRRLSLAVKAAGPFS